METLWRPAILVAFISLSIIHTWVESEASPVEKKDGFVTDLQKVILMAKNNKDHLTRQKRTVEDTSTNPFTRYVRVRIGSSSRRGAGCCHDSLAADGSTEDSSSSREYHIVLRGESDRSPSGGQWYEERSSRRSGGSRYGYSDTVGYGGDSRSREVGYRGTYWDRYSGGGGRSYGRYSGGRSRGRYSGGRSRGRYSGGRSRRRYSGGRSRGRHSGGRSRGWYSGRPSRESGGRYGYRYGHDYYSDGYRYGRHGSH